MLDILSILWGWLTWLAPMIFDKEDILKRVLVLVLAVVAFCMLCAFTGYPPVEYTNDGVKVHSRRAYEERLILSDEEWDLVMREAIAEAGNQGVKGQALVMCVIINRWRSGKYGETIREVIYAPNQFYVAGMYANDLRTTWEGSLTSGQRRQILDAYAARSWVEYGWDESEGALYFCADGWNYYGEEHLFKYGGHWFSK